MASQPVPVEACEGWVNSCSYCNKKFSSWIPIEEEDAMGSVPTQPGVFAFAFETKRGKEVVVIGMHKSNIQTSIVPQLRELRRQISQKKFKETKASIFLRYVIMEDMASRDACSVLIHWHNYGILPRLITRWPGLEILNRSPDFEYVEEIQKWCYPFKDPVWKKEKSNTGPQAVQKCKGWKQNCSYCDGKFTVWLPLEEASVRKDDDGGAPKGPGLCMFAANKKGKRQILHLCTEESIKKSISTLGHWISYTIKSSKEIDPDSTAEVRWMSVSGLEDPDSCFMYAHFLNCGQDLPTQHELPGSEILERSEKFVFRQRDKQWCYDQNQTSQSKKVSKTKERREMMRSMLEDLHT